MTIAAGQFVIALAMPLTGWLFKAGCIAGIFFSVAILPLGLGAAFPAMVFLAMGFYQLWRHPADRQLWKRPTTKAPGRQLQPQSPANSFITSYEWVMYAYVTHSHS
jgi:hypothetical protein